jgi:Transposase DDE domain group 1
LVIIKQKTVKHSPTDKLLDGFITILAGAHGLCEINTRLRSDLALQRAFGRSACAEQSVVQQTLDACTSTKVAQMMQALDIIFHQHSLAYRHDYKASLQVLDIDMTGMPCGKHADESTKGYFGRKGIRYGRQMGRVVASLYEEVVIDRLYPGNIQLTRSLRPLITDAEQTLGLDEEKRQRTVLRVDAGGGSFDDVNWMLERGYQVHCKNISSKRAEIEARSVIEWFDDPRHPGRQLGWAVPDPTYDDGWNYVRPVRRLIIRWAKKRGRTAYAMMILSLEPKDVIRIVGLPVDRVSDAVEVMMAYAHFYDQRGGTVEIEIREDKQGVGITKRSKKRFEAQQMVMLLGSLAHNVMVWMRGWLSQEGPKIARLGIVRLVRDLMQVSGFVQMDGSGRIGRIALNQASAEAGKYMKAFSALLRPQRVVVSLGST